MQQMGKRTLCLLTIVLIATGAGATTLMKMDTASMAVQADAIVVGQCTAASSQWVGGALLTLVDVEVDESLKGGTSNQITLVIPGGVDADRPVPVAVTVPGAPIVFQNEDVLLFLNHSNAVAGGYAVVGFSQGKFSVVEDAAGNQLAAQGRHTGDNAVSLDEMRVEIQAALEE